MLNEDGLVVSKISSGEVVKVLLPDEDFIVVKKSVYGKETQQKKKLKVEDTTTVNFNYCKFNAICCPYVKTTLLLKLIPFVSFTSGIIADDDGNILSLDAISIKTELSLSTVRRGIAELLKLKIIGKGRIDGRSICFIMNPFICHKGSRVSKDLYELFKDTMWNKKGDIDETERLPENN